MVLTVESFLNLLFGTPIKHGIHSLSILEKTMESITFKLHNCENIYKIGSSDFEYLKTIGSISDSSVVFADISELVGYKRGPAHGKPLSSDNKESYLFTKLSISKSMKIHKKKLIESRLKAIK